LRANGSRERAPDDRLREAIHAAASGEMDCLVALLLTMTLNKKGHDLTAPAVNPPTIYRLKA